MSMYNFALQWLDYLGVELYNKGKRILEYDGEPDYNISELNTHIKVGQELGEEDDENEYVTMYWSELDSVGYAIKHDPMIKWKPGQRGSYKIIKKTRNSNGLGYNSFKAACSRGKFYVEHDQPNRRIRLRGDLAQPAPNLPVHSGIGPWIQYDTEYRLSGVNRGRYAELYDDDDDEEPVIQNIPEIPILLTPDKYLVCIPKSKACQKIIVVGDTGTGKSVCVNGIAGRVFYKWEDRVGWLLDPLNQLYNISAPQDYQYFNNMLNWIGEEPKPIPAIQLYLACKYKPKIVHDKISMILSLDFHEFLRKYKFYTHGIKEYDVEKSYRYMTQFVKDIKNISSDGALKDFLFQNIPESHNDKGMQSMIYKWVNTFETIFKDKFTSNLYKGDANETHKLKVKFPDGKEIEGHPFIMAMEAGLVPVINTALARKQKWIRNYMADLMNKIVMHQVQRGEEKNRLWIVADELNEIYEEKSGKKMDNCGMSFIELFRQGRINDIGFIGNTQSLKKLNEDMFDNASHVISTQLSDTKGWKKFGEVFKLHKEDYEQIGELKKLEMIAFSKNEPFILYDRWGRKKKGNRRWYRGKVIPPINCHMAEG